jgi:hypothetical protein
MNRLLYRNDYGKVNLLKTEWYKIKLEKVRKLDKWIKNEPVINIESVVKNKQ